MKTLISTVLLSLGSALALAQAPEAPASEIQIGYGRETFKIRDIQASPMLYVANLNSLRLGYQRRTPNIQWRVELTAGLGDLVAPSLGIRGFKFSPEQEQPLWLVPTLYRGQLRVEYLHRIRRSTHRSSWLGLGLHETAGYADGLALSTWAYNSADLRLLYQSRLSLGKRHTLSADASLPLLAAVTRMPYSNVVSEPTKSEVASFFGHTRLAMLNHYLSPEMSLNYRFKLSRRVSFGAGYRYTWLYYSEPRTIRTASHQIHASLVYTF